MAFKNYFESKNNIYEGAVQGKDFATNTRTIRCTYKNFNETDYSINRNTISHSNAISYGQKRDQQ